MKHNQRPPPLTRDDYRAVSKSPGRGRATADIYNSSLYIRTNTLYSIHIYTHGIPLQTASYFELWERESLSKENVSAEIAEQKNKTKKKEHDAIPQISEIVRKELVKKNIIFFFINWLGKIVIRRDTYLSPRKNLKYHFKSHKLFSP